MKRAYAVFLLVAVSTAGIIWLSPAGPLAKYWLAGHWEKRLDAATDQEVEAYLGQMALLDGSGLGSLVDALANPRDQVSTAARQTLHQLLDRWQREPVRQSSPKIARLAKLLAEDVRKMNRSGRIAAADLAERILQWPISNPRTDRAQIVVDCDTVIRLALSESSQTPAEPVKPKATESVTHVAQQSPSRTSQATERFPNSSAIDGPDVTVVPDLPGGDLPVTPTELPPLPPSLTTPRTPRTASMHEAPGLIPIQPAPLAPNRFSEPNPFGTPLDPSNDSDNEPRELAPSGREPTLATRTSGSSDTLLSLRILSERELIQRLDSNNVHQDRITVNELRRRGFSDIELRLARLLNTSDAATRRGLVESLGNLPIAPRRWLLWLSQDDSAEVRLAAAIRMATSRDPVLHRRLQTMQRTESDEQVRRQLDRWAASQVISR